MSFEADLAWVLLAIGNAGLALDPALEKPRGVLEIEVRESGAAAPGFLVEAERDDPPLRAVTDSRGLAVFHEVRPGTWKIRANGPEGSRRGDVFYGQVEIQPGKTSRCVFDLVLVSGSIALRHPGDLELEEIDGWFTIHLPFRREPKQVEFADGFWKTVFHRGEIFDPEDSRLFGGKFLGISSEPTLIESDCWIELRAHSLHDPVLRAYDASNGDLLEEFWVADGSQYEPSSWYRAEVAGPANLLRLEVQPPSRDLSREDLFPDRAHERFWFPWVGGNGFAWKRVLVDRAWPGETPVLLEPGFDLEIELRPFEPASAPATLLVDRVLEEGIARCWEAVLQGPGKRRIGPLPAGEFLVRACLPFDGREVAERVLVRKGKPHELTLELPAPAASTGSVEGRIEPEDQGILESSDASRRLVLRVESLDRPCFRREPAWGLSDFRRKSAGGLWDEWISGVRWSCEELPPGSYRVIAWTGPHSRMETRFEVRAGEVAEVEQIVPGMFQRKRVHVDALDIETGMPIRVRPTLRPLAGGSFTNAWPPMDNGRWSFDALNIDGPFWVIIPGHVPLLADQDLEPGDNALTSFLQPAAMLEVTLQDLGREVHPSATPWSDPENVFFVEPLNPRANVSAVPLTFESKAFAFASDRGGWFVVHSCPPSEFLPPSPVLIELTPGKTTCVEIPLQRTRGN